MFILSTRTLQTIILSLVYSPCGTKSRHDLDLQLWLISRAGCCNTFKISIFWWWRASQEARREEQKRGAHTVRMRQRASDWAKECEDEQVWERKRERETVVMINARLPPLCSSEWLQQKAQNNIPDSLLCFSPSLARGLSHSLCVSAGGQRLHSQICRGYAETELEARSWGAINKLGLVDHGWE